MARMTGLLLAVLALALLLAGCVSRYERDMALAAERTAQEGYLAQQAQFQALAQQADAQARERIATVEAQERTERAQAWYNVLPWLLAIAGGVACASLVLWYRGRAHLVTVQAQAQVAMMLPPPWQWPALPPPTQRPALPARDEAPAAVARAAERVGGLYRPDPDTPGAWLIETMDGSRRIRMLPAPRE